MRQPTPLATELLGFPPDARVLLLNADDLGMHEAVNAGILDAVENGVVSSCSLMTPCPGAPDAIRLLRDRLAVPFGIHLTLVRDTERAPWGPLADPALVPSLLDPDGRFLTNSPGDRARLLGQARVDEVEREFRAQIDAAKDVGRSPTHLDFHCLADGGRDDILDLTVALAAEYGLAVRIWLEPARRRLRERGLPVVDHLFLDSFALPTEDKHAHYAALLRALPPGLSEWAVHPALDTPQWRAAEPEGWRVRDADHAFLTSPEARDLIRREGITVIDYRVIQRAWRDTPRPDRRSASR
ncbi:polysaccharide deacetylase family protein [Streptomyces hainanensis]|uniref:ChbG/HpnK family deacetylase n=1 Tax=Streptomyces hainanensis TaxID=402648 RepID=A0A4R4SHL8_9ACTN|nr:polysaccharide deacetylase family protein [Streptomyces hainanensis]TDC62941.1 ChbG/HpnK family deacetylase [Streptomyces hainanensis]